METDAHFLDIESLTTDTLGSLISSARSMRERGKEASKELAGKQVALIFERPSTRTRVSFEVGVSSMGGHPIPLQGADMQLGRGETVEDTARALSLYVDAIVIRTHSHERLEQLAAAASVPVINALSDAAHPCQALADLQTIDETFGAARGVRITYLGDGNNVARSLMFACAKAGANFTLSSPTGFQPPSDSLDRAAAVALANGGSVKLEDDPKVASQNAQVLYTDTWTSMGQEDERHERLEAFDAYRVDDEKLWLAEPDAIVMHCLPAHRGEEISAPAIDGSHSRVWQQAGNRLFAQKALLARLLAS